MVGGDLLDQPAVVLEQDEMAQVFQQQLAPEHAQGQRLQLAHRPQRIDRHAIDGAPGQEALAVGGERAHPGEDAVAHHLRQVGVEQVGDVLLVGLQLVPGRPDVGVLITGVLQFHHHQRQAVDEQHHVGPTGQPGPLHAELVDRQPVIGRHIGEVDQPHARAAGLPVLLELHRHAIDQPALQLSVGVDQARHVGIDDTAQRVVPGRGRNLRVEPGDGSAQPVDQDHVAVGIALGAGRLGVGRGDVRAVGSGPAEAGQPAEQGLFDCVFADPAHRPLFPLQWPYSATWQPVQIGQG